MRISHKLFATVALPSLMIWGVGWYCVTKCETSLTSAIARTSEARATDVMDEIDRAIHNRITEWVAYSHSSLVAQTVDESNRQFEQQADREEFIDREDAQWREAGNQVETPLMTRLLSNELSRELRRRLARLSLDNGYDVFGEVFLTNQYGANVGQSGRTSDYRQNDETWWQIARRDGIYVGDVGFDDSAEVFSTDICIRIDDDQGRFAGVLKAVLNIREAIKIIDLRSDDPVLKGHRRLALFTGDKQLIHVGHETTPPLADGTSFFSADDLSGEQRVISCRRTDATTGDLLLSTYARSQGYGGFRGLGWIVLNEDMADKLLKPVDDLKRNIRWMALAATIVSLMFGGLCAFSLSRRIKRLSRATTDMGQGNFDVVLSRSGNDELGMLCDNFNEMCRQIKDRDEKLSRMNRELLETARKAGMAEVASEVLHNVGNVLNSLIVSSEVLSARVRDLRLSHLRKTVQAIEEHQHDLPSFLAHDERGKKLTGFLRQLSDHFCQEREAVLEESARIDKHIKHIRDVVQVQQSYTGKSGIRESCEPAQLMNDALLFGGKSFERRKIKVVRQYDDAPCVEIEKAKLLQVLVNLIINAGEALELKDPPKQATLGVRLHGDDFVRFEVSDNGPGIAADDLQRIFNHGFTTKPDGRGFGLHSAANSAMDLGGSLSARSDGPGQGATFIVDIPLQPAMVTS